MAKVTVYVKDEQLKTLKEEMGGASKAFQAFIDEVGSGDRPLIVDSRTVRRQRRRRRHRDDFAARIMPTTSAIERLVSRVADEMGDDGPRADSGPVSVALAVLAYQAVVSQHPEAEERLAKEFQRFGLDELVASAAASFDIEAADGENGEDGEDDSDEADGENIEVRKFRVRKVDGEPLDD